MTTSIVEPIVPGVQSKIMLYSTSFNNTRFYLNGEMAQWCINHIGPGGWLAGHDGHTDDVWHITSMFGTTNFSFRHEKDCAWFMLRWSK